MATYFVTIRDCTREAGVYYKAERQDLSVTGEIIEIAELLRRAKAQNFVARDCWDLTFF